MDARGLLGLKLHAGDKDQSARWNDVDRVFPLFKRFASERVNGAVDGARGREDGPGL